MVNNVNVSKHYSNEVAKITNNIPTTQSLLDTLKQLSRFIGFEKTGEFSQQREVR